MIPLPLIYRYSGIYSGQLRKLTPLTTLQNELDIELEIE